MEWYLKVNVASLFVATVTSLLHFQHKNRTDALLKVKATATLHGYHLRAAQSALKDLLAAAHVTR
jgi:DNA-nicking Smr family endonuclease